MTPGIKDAGLKVTRALPASITAVTSTAIDTGKSSRGDQPGELEYLLTAPLVTITELPDTKTMTYAIIGSDSSDLSNPTTLIPNAIVQTGATGGSQASSTYRFRLPTTGKRYLGVSITPSTSGTGDASGKSATLEAIF